MVGLKKKYTNKNCRDKTIFKQQSFYEKACRDASCLLLSLPLLFVYFLTLSSLLLQFLLAFYHKYANKLPYFGCKPVGRGCMCTLPFPFRLKFINNSKHIQSAKWCLQVTNWFKVVGHPLSQYDASTTYSKCIRLYMYVVCPLVHKFLHVQGVPPPTWKLDRCPP